MTVALLPNPGVPLLEELREGRTQAVHTGHAVVLDAKGAISKSWGNPKEGAYWRSSAKPLQTAAGLVGSGAADAFGFGPDLVALACASHNSEPRHVDGARRMLAAAGLKESDLGCGAHEPIGGARAGPRPAGGWSAIHNNCSGKHAGMLAACVHKGWPTEGYLDPEHPLQKAIRAVVGERTGEPVAWGTDGCSAPVFWSSITGMARAFQRHDASSVGRRVFDAMAAEPWMVAGTGRFCTALMHATKGHVVGKVGAAGLYVALNRTTGEALAVKVASGAREVGELAAAELMDELGWLDDHLGDGSELLPFLDPHITTCLGKELGTTRGLY
jgi:L-asparaginase II